MTVKKVKEFFCGVINQRPAPFSIFLLGFISIIALTSIFKLFWDNPRKDYPLLTIEDRKTMDIKLFNELSVVNSAWIGKTRQMRYELIKGMGDKGFEVADLAIDLLDVKPGSWNRSFNQSAYKRLIGLAEEGDSSAQCLVTFVFRRWGIKGDEYEKNILSAASADHGDCMYALGLLSMPASRKYQIIKMNEVKGRSLILRAAKKGVQSAQLYLLNVYARGRNNYPLDIGKAHCWFTLAQRADTGKTISTKGYLNRWTRMAKEEGVINDNKYDPELGCEIFDTTVTITMKGVKHDG